MAAPLASAFIDLSVKYGDMKDDVDREFVHIERRAEQTGKRIQQSISSGLTQGLRYGGQTFNRSVHQAIQPQSLGQQIAQAVMHPIRTLMGRGGEQTGREFSEGFARSGRSSGHSAGLTMGTALLAGLKASGLAAAAAGVGATFFKGFERLSAIENATTQMTALGYSMDQVNQIAGKNGDIMKIVTGTAYSFSDAMTYVSSALGSGLEPGAQLNRYMQTMVDTASMAHAPLSEIGMVFNQINAAQNLFTQDINQLVQRGLPVWSWLQEMYPGVAPSEIRKMVEERKIDSGSFFNKLAQETSGQAQAYGKTVQGSLSNLWTGVGRLGANILEPIFGDLPSFLQKTTTGLDQFGSRVRPIVEKIVGWFKDTLLPGIRNVLGYLRERWDEMWPRLEKKLPGFFAAVKKTWEDIKPVVKAVGAFIIWTIGQIITHLPEIVDFATKMHTAFDKVWTWVRDTFWPGMRDTWTSVTSTIENAYNRIKIIFNTLTDAYGRVRDFFINAGREIKDSFAWMNTIGNMLQGNFGGVNLTASTSGMPGTTKNAAGLLPVTQNVMNAMDSTFPGHTIGGYRQDAAFPNEHPAGKAIDFMIGNNVSEGYAYLPYALSQPGVTYVIFDNKMWYPDGRSEPYNGSNPHTDHLHIHTEPGAGGNTVGGVSLSSTSTPLGMSSSGTNWDAIAAKESGGNWSIPSDNQGAPFRGGLQILDSTWAQFGGTAFAPTANLASKDEQIAIAERILAGQGPGAWPNTYKYGAPGVFSTSAGPISYGSFDTPLDLPPIPQAPGDILQPGPPGPPKNPVDRFTDEEAHAEIEINGQKYKKWWPIGMWPTNSPVTKIIDGIGRVWEWVNGASDWIEEADYWLSPGDQGPQPNAQRERRGLPPLSTEKPTGPPPPSLPDLPPMADFPTLTQPPTMPFVPSSSSGGGIGQSVGAGLGRTGASYGGTGNDAAKMLQEMLFGPNFMSLFDILTQMLQGGFEGTGFSDPTSWPNVKSLGALMNFGAGLIPSPQGIMNVALGMGGGGGKSLTPKQLQDTRDKIEDLTKRKKTQEMRLQELMGSGSAKPSTLQSAQDSLNKTTRELKQAEELLNGTGGLMNTAGVPGAPGGGMDMNSLMSLALGAGFLKGGLQLGGGLLGGGGIGQPIMDMMMPFGLAPYLPQAAGPTAPGGPGWTNPVGPSGVPAIDPSVMPGIPGAPTGPQPPMVDASIHIGENGVVGQDPVAVRDQANREQGAQQRNWLGQRRVMPGP